MPKLLSKQTLEEWGVRYPNHSLPDIAARLTVPGSLRMAGLKLFLHTERATFNCTYTNGDDFSPLWIRFRFELNEGARPYIHVKSLHSSDVEGVISNMRAQGDDFQYREEEFPPANHTRSAFVSHLLGSLTDFAEEMGINHVSARCADLGSAYWAKMLVPTDEAWNKVRETAKSRLPFIHSEKPLPARLHMILDSDNPLHIRELGSFRQRVNVHYLGHTLPTSLSTALLFDNVWVGANTVQAIKTLDRPSAEDLGRLREICLAHENKRNGLHAS